jgi:3',5'-cyclic AMP phosphodiesterase CpdA
VRARRGAALLAALALALAGCGQEVAAAPTPAVLPPIVQPFPTRFPTPTGAPAALQSAPPAAPAGAAPDWTFAVVGDTWKDTPMLRYILRDATAAGDVALIDLGDLTPQGRPEQLADFARLAGGAGLPVYAVPGNHDIAWSRTTGPFSAFWPRHQSFDIRNAHFTLADNSGLTFTPAELAWIEADLAGAAQPLKFVFMHVPALMPYPVPSESALQAGGPEFMALMAKYHVTAVYAGHLHAYSRAEQDGVAYIITGGGGEPLHLPAFLGGSYHYVRVEVRGADATDSIIGLAGVPTPAP